MPAVGKAQTHDRIPGLQHGKIDRHVRLGAAVGLHIGMIRAVEFAGPVPGQILHDVHILASAVIALSRVSFGIFVCQAGAHRGHDSRGNKVFAGDQLDMRPLSVQLQFNRFGHFRVRSADDVQFHSLSS